MKGYVQRSEFPALANYSGRSAFVVKGVRRCGKSTLMMQLMLNKFPNDFLYFNFDDERVEGFESADFQALMETMVEQHGDIRNVFFDEIQNVRGWELFVNRLLRQGYRVFITGSNANLLSAELGTHLTGRHTDMELYPFSFAEFLRAKGIDAASGKGAYTTAARAAISKAFAEYMETGGMPEPVVFSDETALTQLVGDIIQKDILGRYGVRKPAELRSVLKFLIANASNMMTYNSIVENFRISSPNTVRKYVEYAAEAYLLFEVRRFERRIRKLDKNPRKVYCIDNGIMTRNFPALKEQRGALLENAVAIQLKRLGGEFFYYRNASDWETDFVVPGRREAIQVCYRLDPGNEAREVRGLVEAVRDTKSKSALILTMEQERTMQSRGVSITVKPVWQWLLENEPAYGSL